MTSTEKRAVIVLAAFVVQLVCFGLDVRAVMRG